MDNETPGWFWWLVALIGFCLLAAFLWTGSWRQVFNWALIFVGIALSAALMTVILSFWYSKGGEIVSAAEWIRTLDKRLDQLEEQIKMNEYQIDQARRAHRGVENALNELSEILKKDSRTVAEKSVEEAVDSVISTL